ncbi:MAG TPA: hypothetical protein PKC18_01605, partial [Lacipirellulaceae bacterium]|nr:hypothetical protein [Lacipirellulaceae bacterium]
FRLIEMKRCRLGVGEFAAAVAGNAASVIVRSSPCAPAGSAPPTPPFDCQDDREYGHEDVNQQDGRVHFVVLAQDLLVVIPNGRAAPEAERDEPENGGFDAVVPRRLGWPFG